MNDLQGNKDVDGVTSVQLADQLNVRHDDVLRVIRRLIDNGLDQRTQIALVDYIDEKQESRPMYIMDLWTALIISPYLGGPKSLKVQTDLVYRCKELEDQKHIPVKESHIPIKEKRKTKDYMGFSVTDFASLYGKRGVGLFSAMASRGILAQEVVTISHEVNRCRATDTSSGHLVEITPKYDTMRFDDEFGEIVHQVAIELGWAEPGSERPSFEEVFDAEAIAMDNVKRLT